MRQSAAFSTIFLQRVLCWEFPQLLDRFSCRPILARVGLRMRGGRSRQIFVMILRLQYRSHRRPSGCPPPHLCVLASGFRWYLKTELKSLFRRLIDNCDRVDRDRCSGCDHLKSIEIRPRRCDHKLTNNTPALLFGVKKYNYPESSEIPRSPRECTK